MQFILVAKDVLSQGTFVSSLSGPKTGNGRLGSSSDLQQLLLLDGFLCRQPTQKPEPHLLFLTPAEDMTSTTQWLSFTAALTFAFGLSLVLESASQSNFGS